MKNLILTVLLASFAVSISNAQSNLEPYDESKLVVHVGGQYLYNTVDDYFSLGFGNGITIDYSGLMMNVGGEFKLGRILSTAIDFGLLGSETAGTETTKFFALSVDPVRVYFSEALSGAFIAPRALLTSASDENGNSATQFSPGLVLGFSYSPPGKPIAIGINVSAHHGVSDGAFGGQGIFTIGYRL